MKSVVTKEMVDEIVSSALPDLAFDLPCDVLKAFESAFEDEPEGSSRDALSILLANARIAREDRVALCQDTGSVWVCLEAGPDCMVEGDCLAGVNALVSKAYIEGNLRKSLVRDALFDRSNTGDNTPAFCEVSFVDKLGARIHIMCKGGGSDNASRIVMLPPAAGREGVIASVVDCVKEKAANACPPLVLGVGIGATFDTVAHLAKMALMRPIGEANANADIALFERELLDAVNSTGIGAAALGGKTTALSVNVETHPCHIAALPLAINMGCSAMRRGTYELEF